MESRAQTMRITNLTAGLMLGIAGVFDGVQFLLNFLHVIPVAGTAIAFVATGYIGITASWIIFPLWFKLQDVEYFKGRQAIAKIAALGIPAVCEFITLLNAIPAIVCGVFVTVGITRFEDVFGDGKGLAAALAAAKTPEDRRKLQKEVMSSMLEGRKFQGPQEEEDPQYAGMPKPREGSEEDLRRKRERVKGANAPMTLRGKDFDELEEEEAKQFDIVSLERERQLRPQRPQSVRGGSVGDPSDPLTKRRAA